MPTAYSPGSGKVETELCALARKELVRNLNQQAGAVAGFGIATARAAMGQIDQDLNALLDDLWLFSPRMLATNPMPQASCSLRRDHKDPAPAASR